MQYISEKNANNVGKLFESKLYLGHLSALPIVLMILLDFQSVDIREWISALAYKTLCEKMNGLKRYISNTLTQCTYKFNRV